MPRPDTSREQTADVEPSPFVTEGHDIPGRLAVLALFPVVLEAVFVALALSGWPRAGAEHRIAAAAPGPFVASAFVVALPAAAALLLCGAVTTTLARRFARFAALSVLALLAVLPVLPLLFFSVTGTLPSLELARQGLPFLLRDRTGWGQAGLAAFTGILLPWLALLLFVLRAGARSVSGSTAVRSVHATALLLVAVALVAYGTGTVLVFASPGAERSADSSHHLLTSLLPRFRLIHPAGVRQDGGPDELRARLERELPPRADLARYLSGLGDFRGDRPNVVVVLLEGVAADHVGFFGYHRETTPALDALAAGGAAFFRAYAAANESKNGQTAILASVLPMRATENNFVTSDLDYPRVPGWEVFRSLGYRTGFISTQDETWLGMIRFQLHGLRPPHLYVHALQIPEGETFPDRKKDEGPVVRRSIEWMRHAVADGAPFLLVTNFQRTHFPYQLPRGVVPRFGPLADLGPRFRRWTPDDLPAGVNNFDSALHYVDSRLKELLDGLRAIGVERDTIVAVVSDHGQGFEAGLEPVSMSLEEPYVRVPLVFSWPGRIAPQRFDADVSSIDVFPTVLGLLGVPPCPAWDGRDVLKPGRPSRPVYSASLVWEARWLLLGPRVQVLVDLLAGTANAFPRGASLGGAASSTDSTEREALLGRFLEDYARRSLYYSTPELRRTRLYADPAPAR